jgi:ATP-binding cassette subfamily F protein 3
MIDFEQVSKSYGEQDVLLDASFRINEGERVGIVGPNGTGKSTVFAILCDEVSPDKGSVRLTGGTRIGHLRQQFDPHAVTAPLLEYAESGRPELEKIETQIHELEHLLHSDEPQDKDKTLKRLGGLQSEFEAAGGYDARARAEAALFGLGFRQDDMRRPFSEFSGGWQMRGELARVLVSDPDVILLDEPTNYLDIPAIEWLQKYMRGFKSTMLLISHDRYLLNSLTSVTIEIANAVATKYPGNYDYYVKERALRIEQTENAQKNQDREIKRAEQFITRFRAKNTKAALVKSKMKQLERMERIAGPRQVKSRGRIRLKKPERAGQEIVRLEDVGLTYDDDTWVLKNIVRTAWERVRCFGFLPVS